MRRPLAAPCLTARALAALLMQATAATAGTPFYLDPIATHANGMPMATSDPVRDADTLRGCSRDHVGCCGGRYNMPLFNSLLHPRSCADARPLVLDDHTPGGLPAGLQAPPTIASGLETERIVHLGAAPNALRLIPGGAGQAGGPLGPPSR